MTDVLKIEPKTVGIDRAALEDLISLGLNKEQAVKQLLNTPNRDINLALALAHAERGWAVFPCHESPWIDPEGNPRKEKEPYTAHGWKDATTDIQKISSWWKAWPNAIVGIPCTPNNIFVVDIDVKDGKDGLNSWYSLVDIKGAGDPPACGPMQSTPSGGLHLVFKNPADVKVPNNSDKLGNGLDLRSTGYICTGKLADGSAYKWDAEHTPDTLITDAPEWLLEEIKNLKAPKAAAPQPAAQPSQPALTFAKTGDKWLQEALSKTSAGEPRNETGFWMAGQLRDDGLTESEASRVMLDFAGKVPQPSGKAPYTATEALKSLSSAYTQTQRQPAKGAGSGSVSNNGHVPADSQPQESKERRKDPLGAEYVGFLKMRGYDFKLCSLDDSLWVNDERISDPLEAEIKTLLRDNGYGRVNVAADAWLAHARKHTFNPITDYFDSLEWDGMDHIEHLAGYISDRHNNISMVLRKWAIGAVARPVTGGRQNRVMVFEGKQRIGKSSLARWIASPLEKYFSEAMPDPDNKDTRLALATTWIWEIKELGAVTRRADRESLKAWLTLQGVTERPPFGKHVVYKSAITSFIATVNDEGGFFNDPTGSKRYMTVAIDAIDWDYSKNVNINQFWAQAVHLFKTGEDWNLNPAEQARVEEVNNEYEFTPPVYDWLDTWIESAPADEFLPVSDIMVAIKANGTNGSDTYISREISGWMKRHGYESKRQHINIAIQGEAQKKARLVRGYTGVKLLRKDFSV